MAAVIVNLRRLRVSLYGCLQPTLLKNRCSEMATVSALATVIFWSLETTIPRLGIALL